MNRTDTKEQIEIAPAAASAQQRSPDQQQTASVESQSPRAQRHFLLCEVCRAPVDRDQRYCVQCGARQTHASNPAVAYFSAAARGRRSASGRSRATGSPRAPIFGLFFVLLPLAVALGVLVGRSSSTSTNNDKLIAALLSRPAAGAGASTGAASSAATSTGNLPSDFSLGRGFVVKLRTLPVQGTEASTVARVEQEARAKGASRVGLINPKEFRTTPDQGTANYLVYSGEFKSRGTAETALAKLKRSFPGAVVIAVAAVGASGANGAAPAVIAHTAFGTVHRITGSKPTAQQIQQDKQVVQKINKEVGKNYVNAQKGLPDVIAVTGNGGGGSSPSSAPPEGAEAP